VESSLHKEQKGGGVRMITAGVVGSPISHSLSPLLHNTVYDFLGIKATYLAYEVESGTLQRFLENDGSGLNALSLTMPLKEEALTIAHSVSDISRQIQSGNTLNKVNGLWSLTSTDVEGFTHALGFHDQDAKGKVLILGAGATARAVVAACDAVSKTVTVINRNPDRQEKLKQAAPHLDIDFLSWGSTINFNDFDLVVNTTPGDSAAEYADLISSVDGTFFEVLYNPWPTQLLSGWRESGGFGIDGLDLLIHQAISQMEIFTSRTLERDVIAKMLRVVGEEALS
jgi:shikimate dehydrogenase